MTVGKRALLGNFEKYPYICIVSRSREVCPAILCSHYITVI